MAIILASKLYTHNRDEEGNRFPIALENENEILDNLKKYIKSTEKLVVVANNPKNFEENDGRAEVIFESFKKTGLVFKEKVVLDNRNKKHAKEVLMDANLIILTGGKCLCQNKFLKKIKMKRFLQTYTGLVIGISAGTMNLCKVVMNFPEELADLKESKRFSGLGFYEKSIIPHFDGENKTYQFDCEEVDVVNDYILPASVKTEMIGLPNGSYILIDNNHQASLYGDVYKIHNKEVYKINSKKVENDSKKSAVTKKKVNTGNKTNTNKKASTKKSTNTKKTTTKKNTNTNTK